MKELILILLVSLATTVYADFSVWELSDETIQTDIKKAIEDFSNGYYDENGSPAYQRAMNELEENSAIKTSIARSFVLSGSSDSSQEKEVTECIKNCMKWDGLTYKECRTNCREDPDSHW